MLNKDKTEKKRARRMISSMMKMMDREEKNSNRMTREMKMVNIIRTKIKEE